MSLSKITAYFMRDSQDDFLAGILRNATRTDNFYIGEILEADKAKLGKAGIFFQEINKIPETERNIFEVRSRGIESEHIEALNLSSIEDISKEEANTSFPKYYKFDIEGPLLEEYNLELKNIGLVISEFNPPHAYTIRINNNNEYQSFIALKFVKNSRYYDSIDTGIIEIATRAASVPPRMKETSDGTITVYDVLLHTKEDLSSFLEFLEHEKVLIEGAKEDKARLHLKEGSSVLAKLISHPHVKYVYEYLPPNLHNDMASEIIGVYAVNGNPSANVYFGEGEIVGIADTGIDRNHADLKNQIAGATAWGRVGNNISDPNGHGTHVAGSVAGDGTSSNGSIKGMAPRAKIFFQSLLNEKGGLSLPLRLQDLYDEAYAKGVRIHNNSWGSSTASKYTVNSMEVDDFVFKNKDMLLVFSAGNDGTCINPKNVSKGFVDFLSVGSPASAKNVLTVGASRNKRKEGGYAELTYSKAWPNLFPFGPLYDNALVSGDPDSLAAFSSRGPCDDFRIKPDVVAPGTDIASTKSSMAPLANFWGTYPKNDQYAFMGGTSMSAPIVSGFAALVREYFIKSQKHLPSAALLKATIINGTNKMAGEDAVFKFPDLPNYNQGFGLINLSKTIPLPGANIFFYFIDNYTKPNEHFIKTGQGKELTLTLPSPGWIKICLSYTDIPARALQNNLNLLVDREGETPGYWQGNQQAPSLLNQLDSLNNVEIISIDAAVAGTYTIKVVASNLIKGPQDFALAITASDLNTTIA